VARSLAEDLATVIRDDVGIRLSIVSSHGRSADDASEIPGSDGLRVDCIFEDIPEDPKISVAVSIGALESITREDDDELPTAGDPRMTEAMKDVSIEIVAELGRLKVGLRNLLAWRVGQVLRLSTAVDDPVVLRVARVTKFAGRPVISRGQLAVEIRGRADD
jgi:flagellar motor switch/type III secretory pathway protein FliN